MSSRERERLKLFERVKRGELSLSEAAQICGFSYRQMRRRRLKLEDSKMQPSRIDWSARETAESLKV